MDDIITVGAITVRFLLDKEQTNGAMDLFEFTVPPAARVPMPHFHRDFDEASVGLEGTLTWIVDGIESAMGPGQHLFIPRGAVHHFVNRGSVNARVLAVLTPGVAGRGFFRDAGGAIAAAGGQPPAPETMRAIFARYGVVAVPEALQSPAPATR